MKNEAIRLKCSAAQMKRLKAGEYVTLVLPERIVVESPGGERVDANLPERWNFSLVVVKQ